MPIKAAMMAIIDPNTVRGCGEMTMAKTPRVTAANFLPEARDLGSLSEAALQCQGCDLYQHATQTVFGSGSPEAKIVLVGEQPGDKEDIEGAPFVGPAGKLLDGILEDAGMSRDEVYITNVVKHFKYTQRGKRRLHKKPGAREMSACLPWLEAELEVVKPQALVCLGATAAQAILGREFRITRSRGELLPSKWCERTVATWHPSAVLRNPDEERRDAMKQEMVADLKTCQS